MFGNPFWAVTCPRRLKVSAVALALGLGLVLSAQVTILLTNGPEAASRIYLPLTLLESGLSSTQSDDS